MLAQSTPCTLLAQTRRWSERIDWAVICPFSLHLLFCSVPLIVHVGIYHACAQYTPIPLFQYSKRAVSGTAWTATKHPLYTLPLQSGVHTHTGVYVFHPRCYYLASSGIFRGTEHRVPSNTIFSALGSVLCVSEYKCPGMTHVW